jgi:hypothetical protein
LILPELLSASSKYGYHAHDFFSSYFFFVSSRYVEECAFSALHVLPALVFLFQSSTKSPQVTLAIPEPQRALISTINAGQDAIRAAERELDTRAQLPELGTDSVSLNDRYFSPLKFSGGFQKFSS